MADRARVLSGGTAGGITGIHEWLFAETPGGVRVSTTESFSGDPVNADQEAMQNMLDSSLVAWLAHMKAKPRLGRPDARRLWHHGVVLDAKEVRSVTGGGPRCT
jgi:hypothetical protein